tara:strand:- start:142 stop:528 length:387 start_codon:yes stop_codon:yes gene_type:complete
MDSFTIYTLVDVTETNARRGESTLAHNQQANFMSVYQTIGLRSNPTNFKVEKIKDNKKFGSTFKNVNYYWKMTFDIEQSDSLTLEMLLDDFELVPFISGLEECVTFKECIFFTKHKGKTNIIFKKNDK